MRLPLMQSTIRPLIVTIAILALLHAGSMLAFEWLVKPVPLPHCATCAHSRAKEPPLEGVGARELPFHPGEDTGPDEGCATRTP
jgi:hypothetical protein